MTMIESRARLDLAVEEAWVAVGELVLITLEDQPGAGSLAAADDLAEQVSELQGELAGVRARLRERPPAGPAGVLDLADVLPDVLAGLAAPERRYWQRVRAHQPAAQLRAATHRLAGPWPAWRRSVEATALRCEQPLAQAGAAGQACCQELCERVRSTPYDQLRRTS